MEGEASVTADIVVRDGGTSPQSLIAQSDLEAIASATLAASAGAASGKERSDESARVHAPGDEADSLEGCASHGER